MAEASHATPAPAATPVPTLVIEAGRLSQNYWRDLWRYRELLGFLAWRDIMVRYKQTSLGIAWALMQPLITLVVFTFIFGNLAKMDAGGVPYPLLVLAALLPWQLFSSAFSGASGSLVGNANLISKIYFPRLAVPLSAVAVALVDFLLVCGLYVVLDLWYHYPIGWRVLGLPALVLVALLTALGAGLWMTALTVKYRDFRYIVPFLLQAGLFVTPVGFSTTQYPNWRNLLSLNPMTGVVDGFRWCLLGTNEPFYWPGFAISLTLVLLLLVTGVWYFRRMEREFADVI